MGPIAKAVTSAVAHDDDEWFWWVKCERISDIHRRQSWPTDWRDNTLIRILTRYPLGPFVRNAKVLREAA